VWHPDPDQLALAALPAEAPDPSVGAHLSGCALCRGQVESMRRTVQLARDAGDAVDDDAGPPDRVWRAISHELALPPAGPGPGSAARPPRWRRLAGPVLAGVLGVVAGLLVGLAAVPRPADPPASVVAVLVPVGTADPTGSGQVSMVRAADGQHMDVTVRGVRDLAGGDYLEVWLLDPVAGRMVSLGGLTADSDRHHGTFTVPANLPLAEFGTVDVSSERWDGDPTHSRLSVLRGPLS
jgi:hypothetical protein